jgi:phasin family protein
MAAKRGESKGSGEVRGPAGDFDFGNIFAQFQMPGIDVQAMMASQRRNLEALTRANQVVAEGVQAVFQREMEILRTTMEEFAKASRELMTEGDPQAQAARRVELAKVAMERAIANMRELAEMAAKANSEAIQTVNKRFMDSLDELKAMIEKRGT